MRAKRLSSSMIERIAYDEEAHTLDIWFRGGGRRYTYLDVPRAIYDGLGRAVSAGRYFNDQVRGHFRCRPDPARRRFRPLAEG